jgi:hypothetical protein
MNIYAKKGHRVTVSKESIHNGNEYDANLAKKYLKIGGSYTVERTVVQNWQSIVVLEQFPEIEFNTSTFVDVDTKDAPIVSRITPRKKLNIVEAMLYAENGALIRNNFLEGVGHFLKYVSGGVFHEYQVVNGRAIFKNEVREFNFAYVISQWEVVDDNYFK